MFFTDKLNNLAYKSALPKNEFNQISKNLQRITRKELKEYGYSNIELKKIISKKEKFVLKNPNLAIPNYKMLDFLETIKSVKKIIWTCGNKQRIISVLKHYNLSKCYEEIEVSPEKNQNTLNEIISKKKLDTTKTYLLENDQQQTKNLKCSPMLYRL